jgi:hypothetical protein
MNSNRPTSPPPFARTSGTPDFEHGPAEAVQAASGTPSSPQPDQKPGLDLSLTQTLGGALAAMTAAALGSRLGVGGTIVGAALASIIAGVGASLYTESLRRGREKVKTVWSGRVNGTTTPAAVDVVPETPAWELPQAPIAQQPRPRPRLPWGRMLAGAAAVFVIAAVALTGFELLSGSALSGGNGTTIEQVRRGEQPQPKSSSEATASDSPTDSPSASGSPSASESASASETPTDEATPTTSATEPSAAPTEQPTEQPTEGDNPSAEGTQPTNQPSVEGPSAPAGEGTSAPSAEGSPQG